MNSQPRLRRNEQTPYPREWLHVYVCLLRVFGIRPWRKTLQRSRCRTVSLGNSLADVERSVPLKFGLFG
jgi:hypothetical protein